MGQKITGSKVVEFGVLEAVGLPLLELLHLTFAVHPIGRYLSVDLKSV